MVGVKTRGYKGLAAEKRWPPKCSRLKWAEKNENPLPYRGDHGRKEG
jgi:hypothetical protein